MIIIYHQNNKIASIWNELESNTIAVKSVTISKGLLEVAKSYPDDLIVWCHILQKDNLNLEKIPNIFHHQKIMASYKSSPFGYLPDAIGYVDPSPFIKINKGVSYPTWQMSSEIGGIFSSVMNTIADEIPVSENFDYFLHSIAKTLMPKGLFCYSVPDLIIDKAVGLELHQATVTTLFRFVKQHYRLKWLFLLFINMLIYEKKIPLWALLRTLAYKCLRVNTKGLNAIPIISAKTMRHNSTIDVIIPTIGRKRYLYDILQDLSQQTQLPTQVIIVEQNPLADSQSELDYIHERSWPFKVKLIFTHQTGACHARNLALEHINSEWIFFADDDIRISSDFLASALQHMKPYQNQAYTINCLRNGEETIHKTAFQWSTFGSGCSFVKRDTLSGISFDKRYEFGFGEDADFGMQLRNKGIDIIYLPTPTILHLKAPVGGFRTKPVLAWTSEKIKPKPSPTVMLYKLLYQTPKQLLGYKTTLFFKFYTKQMIRNPFAYYQQFQKQWKQSLFWTEKL